jgi:hypothetical protein
VAAARAGEFGHSVKGGIVAGIIGGIAISVWMLISTLVQGMDPWMIFKGAGAPFLGERAMQPGFDGVAVLVGTLCHFGISIVWGALFGVLFYGLSRAATVAMGVVWGVVVWLAMYYLVLPLVGLGAITESVPPWKAAVEHVLFGVVVALGFLPFQRRVTRHVPRPLAPTRPTPTTPAT